MRARRVGVIAAAGVWWLALVTAFLLNRRNDAGELASLTSTVASRLSAGPILGRSVLDSLAGLLIAAGIGLAWYGLGTAIVHRFAMSSDRPRDALMQVVERSLVGAATWSLLWFFLGLLPLYRPSVAVAALAVGLGLAVLALPRSRPSIGTAARLFGGSALGLLITGQLLALAAALAPPTAKDTLLYHYSVPKAWIAAGRAIEIPYNVAAYYPLGVELHALWAMLLGGPLGVRAAEAAAGATLFLFAPLLALATYGWARERGAEPAWAATAALMMSWIPTVYHVAANGYVDLALTCYTVLAVRAFGGWWTGGRWPAPAWLAVGIGGALSIKLSAGFLLLPLALLGLLRALALDRRDGAHGHLAMAATAAKLAIALTLGVTIALPWYVRNWVRTGSPLFPFYLELWPAHAPGWDVERSRLYATWFSLYGDVESPFDYLWSPIRLAVTAQPDLHGAYDGVLGIAILFGIPLVAWAVWRRRLDVEIRLALLLSVALYLFWLFSSQQLRYLLPAAPALVVAIAVAGSRLEQPLGRVLRALLLGAAALGLPVILAWFLALDPTRVVLGGESREAFLTRRLDYYPYYQMVNRELPSTATVWLIDMRRDTYHLDRPAFSDFIFEDYTLTRYVREAATLQELRTRVRAAGITHLLVRHDILFDYARSPIVDEHRSREENVAKLQLMHAFFTQGTRLMKGDAKFWLIELP